MANKVNAKKISNDNEMMNFIKMIIIVVIVFCVFYVLTVFINKDNKSAENNSNNENNTSAQIQYDEILVGNIFKQSNSNYYVLIKDNKDVNIQTYEVYLNAYEQKQDSKRVYTAVLNNMFNSKYLAENSNLVDDISQFRVNKTILLEINDGKILKSYEKHEDILNLLKEISKTEKEN